MAERIHRDLALAAAAIMIAGFFEWRSLRPAKAGSSLARAEQPVPSPQLRQLMPYSGPLVDSQLVLHERSEAVVLRRDPFATELPARVAETQGTSQPHPAATDSTQWHVSATLISSARRAAIINDVLLYVGDRVPGGGKLVAVERDRVVLTDSKGASHTVIAEKEGT